MPEPQAARAGCGSAKLAAVLAVLVLAGCASRAPAPVRPGESPAARAGSGAAAPAGLPPAAGAAAGADGARRGGFYLDDGPGQGMSVDPASVPDAVPRPEPLHPRANRPYVVFERQYVPMTRLEPFSERGVATWYGRRYHGQRTSSGEPYDMYAMTAAHPTLPIPSYAQVTHLRNGRRVVVRVNDRGPFLHGRVIDLSWTAAARLGYVQAGSAEVEVVLIDDPVAWVAAAGGAATTERSVVVTATPTATPAAATASTAPDAPLPLSLETLIAERVASPVASALAPGVWLQMGVFAQQERALAIRERAAAVLGQPAAGIRLQPADDRWRVLAGPFGSRADAVAAGERLREATGLQAIPVTVGP